MEPACCIGEVFEQDVVGGDDLELLSGGRAEGGAGGVLGERVGGALGAEEDVTEKVVGVGGFGADGMRCEKGAQLGFCRGEMTGGDGLSRFGEYGERACGLLQGDGARQADEG